MDENTLKNQIRKLIAENKLNSAIELLGSNIKNNESLDEIIIQLARYNAIKKESIQGTITSQELNQELNALRRNILSLIREETLIIQDPSKEDFTLRVFKETLNMSLTRVKVANYFLAQYEKSQPVSISDTVLENKLKSRKLVVDFFDEMKKVDLLSKKKEGNRTYWMINEEGKKIMKEIIK